MKAGPKKTALITGQDGAYLAEFLLKRGYQVHGIKRRASSFNTTRIDHLYQDPHVESRNFILHYGDMTDSSNLIRIVQQVQPDEIYNLAARSHVAVTFDPTSIDDMARAIDRLASSVPLRQSCRAAGVERASSLTWQRCAELTRDLYRRTA